VSNSLAAAFDSAYLQPFGRGPSVDYANQSAKSRRHCKSSQSSSKRYAAHRQIAVDKCPLMATALPALRARVLALLRSWNSNMPPRYCDESRRVSSGQKGGQSALPTCSHLPRHRGARQVSHRGCRRDIQGDFGLGDTTSSRRQLSQRRVSGRGDTAQIEHEPGEG
jgi:hypothetical protein